MASMEPFAVQEAPAAPAVRWHGLRCFVAAVRKNFTLKQRQWVATLLELLLPVALMGLMIWIRLEVKTKDIAQASYLSSPDNNPTWFNKEAQNVTDVEGLDPVLKAILEVACNQQNSTGVCPELFGLNTWNQRKEHYLGVALDGLLPLHMGLLNQRIGVVGTDGKPLARFIEELPGYRGYVKHFEQESDLVSYLRNSGYGFQSDVPQLFGAIHVREVANCQQGGACTGNWDFVIQLNSTGPGSTDIQGATDVNLGLSTPVNNLLKQLQMGNTRIYWSGGLFGSLGLPLPTGGFVDLQTLVYAWIYNSTGAYQMQPPSSMPKCECTDDAGQLTDDLGRCNRTELPTTLLRILTPHWATASNVRGCLGRLSGLMPVSVREVPFPTPKTTEDLFAELISGVFGLFFVLVYIWPLTRIIKSLVEDKEARINEVMKMMGMPAEAITVSWYATYGLMWVLPSALICFICWTTVFQHSDKFIVFLFFWIFGLCVVTLCSFISVFFARAKTASVVGALLFFLLYFPYNFVSDASTASGAKTIASLSPPIALSLGASLIAEFESSGQGVQWGNLGESVDNFTMGRVLLMLIIDTVLFAVLAWYFDKVLVVGFGTRQPWYFLCTPRYWQPEVSGLSADEAADLEQGFNDELPGNARYESVPPALSARKSVLIRGLCKEFSTADGKTLKAVQGVTLNLYSGQIFCLLGHNGAGKSTTINMLSGMLPVSAGDAVVYGRSVVRDMVQIRRILGVCPQHDVIWYELSVLEHLEFFAKVKGIRQAQVKTEVDQIIADVGLEEKRHSLAGTLSGGQKRRLSAAIALIGGSKVVFLDEPSSGVDPFSRRELWDCLRAKKDGRTLILTTHFMDEAEELGDRIAIMAAGQVKCVGSSLFLKSQYGVGYTLTITKLPSAAAPGSSETAALKALLSERCFQAELLSDVGTEIVYRMPMEESRLFPALFEEFERNPKKYGIEIFGVSVTTLEEVFLRVGQDHTEADRAADERLQQHSFVRQLSEERRVSAQPRGSNALEEGMDVPLNPVADVRQVQAQETSSFGRHVHALLVKRYHNSRRDRKAWCCQIVLPLIFLLAALLILKFAGVGDYKPLPLDLDGLSTDQEVVFGFGERVSPAAAEAFMSGLPTSRAGVGNGQQAPMTAEEFDQLLLDGYFRGGGKDRYGAYRFQAMPQWSAGTQPSTVGNWTSSGYKVPGEVRRTDGTEAFSVPVGTFWDETTVQVPGFTNESVPLGQLNNRLQVDLFWNSTARDSVPIFLNTLHETVLRSSLGAERMQAKLKIANQPFPLTSAQKDLTNTQTSIFIALGFAFIPASVGAFVVLERENGCKHLQIISGVNFISYWLATWIWDVINYMVPAVLSIVLIWVFGIDALVAPNALPWTILSVIFYGLSCTSFTYMLSFLFKSHTSAQNLLLIVYLFTGGILLIVSIILSVLDSTKDLMKNVLIYLFRIMPNFCLADALTNLITRTNPGLWIAQGCPFEGCAPSDLKIVGWDLIYMGVGAVLWFLITLVLELSFATPRVRALFQLRNFDTGNQNPQPLDRHVQMEKDRVVSGAADSEMVVLKGIRKVFPSRSGAPPKVAVEEMYFGIKEGECFGYLGMNGAGKTTTMKILTGEELCTSGDATLGGFDIKTQQNKVRHLLGYCPQFDALIGTLTAREHLMLFARIKGVAPGRIDEYVRQMLDKLTLSPYADKQASSFSGGTRRKLSLGIALIGDPRCVFLDEPTTGVDPESRRFMWSLISSNMRGRSVILTTHSMDECEALCGRIGIMVNGRLVCLGSAALLKATHGYGYQFEVTFNSSANLRDAHQRLRQFVDSMFDEGVQCVDAPAENAPLDAYRNRVKYRLPKTKVPISAVFREVEANRTQLQISEYSISETTLEQIFIQFAKNQEPEEAPADPAAIAAA